MAKRATNLQAYLKILEGIAHINESKFSEAKKTLRRGLVAGSRNPRPTAGLAMTYLMDVWFGPSATRAQALGKAFEYGEKCLDQDETNESCHRTLGYAYTLKRDYEKALHHGRRSVELNPNSALSASFLALTLRCVGEYEEAVRQCERAMRLDPRNYFPFFQIGATYVMMKRHEEAIKACRKAVEMNPRHMPSWIVLVMAYSSLDRMEEASAAASEVLKQSPNFSVEHFAKAMPYKDEEPRNCVAKAGLDMLTRVLAAEIGGSGVTANALYPGIVDTEMQSDIRSVDTSESSLDFSSWHEAYDRGSLTSPEQVAEMVYWLVGPWSRHYNGEIFRSSDASWLGRVKTDFGYLIQRILKT